MWNTFDQGNSRGQVGSEHGTIIQDEEHTLGARITLEKDGITAPFAITCGIYGWMVHTRFFSGEAEALAQFESMKAALASVLDVISPPTEVDVSKRTPEISTALARFVERYP
jgi:hypothetical protein